jgi:hypothetical protein
VSEAYRKGERSYLVQILQVVFMIVLGGQEAVRAVVLVRLTIVIVVRVCLVSKSALLRSCSRGSGGRGGVRSRLGIVVMSGGRRVIWRRRGRGRRSCMRGWVSNQYRAGSLQANKKSFSETRRFCKAQSASHSLDKTIPPASENTVRSDILRRA